MRKTRDIECPLCYGKGKVLRDVNTRKDIVNMKIRAKELLNKGLSYREVMRVLGYKSTYSVTRLIK